MADFGGNLGPRKAVEPRPEETATDCVQGFSHELDFQCFLKKEDEPLTFGVLSCLP